MYSKIQHNSHLSYYRNPFGAVTSGTMVHISLTNPYPEVCAHLRLWVNDAERIVECRRAGERCEFTFVAEPVGIIWYYFILTVPNGKLYFGGSGGAGAVYDYPPPSWQITVYKKDFQTPQWWRESIVYQIFPDRFFRADEVLPADSHQPLAPADFKNHLQPPSQRGGLAHLDAHRKMNRLVYAHENWDDDVLFEPLCGEKHYSPCDYFGGNFNGIRAKLPYLQSLGVSCIYLNPIFEAASNHRYNTADYLRCDAVLGTEAELRLLIKAASDVGIRIMLDGVFSHTGDDSVYFDKYTNYGGNGAYNSNSSPYFDWYNFMAWPNSYRSWWGFTTLPEVEELSASYMCFLRDVIKHWAMLGLPSWRLDVADELPPSFIKFLRREIKANSADGVILGEVWEDASIKEGFGAKREYVLGDELDGVMNYPLRDALVDFFMYKSDAYSVAHRLICQRENYPKPFYEACLNLLGSHDTVRIATVLGGAPHRDALTRSEQAHFQLPSAEVELANARLFMAQMLLFALPGVPCVYYADEIGAQGMADPFCRRTFPWSTVNVSQLERFAKLSQCRKTSQALSKGCCSIAAINTETLSVLRTYANEAALVVVNRSHASSTLTISTDIFLTGPDASAMFVPQQLTDIFTGTHIFAESGAFNIVLPPLSGVVLLGEK